MKKIFLLYIISINLLLAQTDSSVFGMKDYFPLNADVELIYNSTIGETKRMIEKVDSLYIATTIANRFEYKQTYIKNNDGIYLLGSKQDVKILFFSKHAEVQYGTPALQIPDSVKIGDVWKWKGKQIKNGEDTLTVTMIGEALGEEEVEVPAGKFNTLKIQIVITDYDVMKTTYTQWLAKDIGAVKIKIQTEGKGIIHFALSILGYKEINSELKEIKTQ